MLTKKQLEAAKLLRVAEGKSAMPGGFEPSPAEMRRAQFRVAESIAYGDLAVQLQPTLVRRLRSYFKDIPQVAPQFTQEWQLTGIDRTEQYNIYDFDQKNIPALNDGETFVAGGLPAIGRRESYPQIGLQATGKTGMVRKFGEAFGVDWETIVNSRGADISLVTDGLSAMSRHSANEREIQVAKLLVASGGFTSTVTSAIHLGTANGASVNNPDLTNPADIAAAFGAVLNQPVGAIGSIAGRRIAYPKIAILTTVANAPLIKRVINSRQLVINPGATTGASYESVLDLGAEPVVIGWDWLTSIWGAMGKGAILVPIPTLDQLPVLTRNRLQGYPEPSLWIKDSDAKALGGGEVDPTEQGDFDSDATVTKLRDVIGASALWTEAMAYTTGANA
jgi:hypothetical protein